MDVNPPEGRPHVSFNAKRLQLERERQARILRDNFILLKKLREIMHRKRRVAEDTQRVQWQESRCVRVRWGGETSTRNAASPLRVIRTHARTWSAIVVHATLNLDRKPLLSRRGHLHGFLTNAFVNTCIWNIIFNLYRCTYRDILPFCNCCLICIINMRGREATNNIAIFQRPTPLPNNTYYYWGVFFIQTIATIYRWSDLSRTPQFSNS